MSHTEFISNLMELDESHCLDFKEEPNNEVAKLIATFANHDGGKIYVGITDKKPREVVGSDYAIVEQRISGRLNSGEIFPRPLVKYEEFQYLQEENTLKVVCISVERSDVLVQYNKGGFPYRDKFQSNTRYLSIEEIKNRFNSVEVIGHEFERWIDKEKNGSNEYLFFCLIPNTLKDEVIDLIHQRDLENYMNSSQQQNGLNISWINERFKHPFEKISEELKFFRDQQTFSTSNYICIHENRTRSKVLIHKNGVVYAKIMYNIITEESQKKNLFLEKIIKNENLYCDPPKDKNKPDLKVGSMSRILYIILSLFSYGDYDWLKENFNSYSLRFALPITKDTILYNSDIFSNTKYLGDESFIRLSYNINLDMSKIWQNSIQDPEQIQKRQDKLITSNIDDFLVLMRIKILGFFGTKSSIYHEGMRSDIHIPLYTKKELQQKFNERINNGFESTPLLNVFSDDAITFIDLNLMKTVSSIRKDNVRVTFYKIDTLKNIPTKIRDWLDSFNEEPIFVGIEITRKSLQGRYYDELINIGTSRYPVFFNQLFSNFLTALISGIPKEFTDEDSIPPGIFPPIENCPTIIENDLKNKIEFNHTEDKPRLIIDNKEELKQPLLDLLRLLEPYEVKNLDFIFADSYEVLISPKLRSFIGFGENSVVEIQDKFINSYNRNYINGYKEPYILVIKSGALGDGAHLLCCIKPISFWDFRNMRAEVIFYLDLPQKSIMKLNID